ncbi:hypothetical protein D7V77_41940 [Corallococcus sp. CA041A]|nr:hypothetical protein D7V77_41940 [Corallococcus sp. CA041A]
MLVAKSAAASSHCVKTVNQMLRHKKTQEPIPTVIRVFSARESNPASALRSASTSGTGARVS